MKTNAPTRFPGLVSTLLLLAMTISPARADAPFLMPVNPGETIVAPFWDAGLNEASRWQVTPAPGLDLKVEQVWDASRLSWTEAKVGTAVTMQRPFDLAVANYDHLELQLEISSGARVEVELDSDLGVRKGDTRLCPPDSNELRIPLNGASRLNSITLRFVVEDDRSKAGGGRLRWIMLSDQKRVEQMLASWRQMAGYDWRGYLVPEGDGAIEQALGLWTRPEEIDRLREKLQTTPDSENPFKEIERQIAQGRFDNPESLIREYVGSGKDRRFSRQRDVNAGNLLGRTALADYGVVARDRHALRLAARTALALAATRFWDAGPTTQSVLSSWEDRPFAQSAVATELVHYLDFAGSQLTPAGRDFILRRLAEQCVGSVNYIAWRYDEIFHMNQLAAFNHGRLVAYLALERYWQRVAPYTDLAIAELGESMHYILSADGGYTESPAYYQYTVFSAVQAYAAYATARHRPIDQLLPPQLAGSPDYAELFQSTTQADAFIPVGDGGGRVRLDLSLLLANLFPDSQWVALAHRALREQKLPADIPLWIAALKLPAAAPAPRAFIALPSIGTAASRREFHDQAVKCLVVGHAKNSTHVHEDAGSFVLEYAGEAFAAEYDQFTYDDPRHELIKQAQRHNVPVPSDTTERAAPNSKAACEYSAKGDGQSFHAECDLTAAWSAWYATLNRTIDSPQPNTFEIVDRYKLLRGDGVDFQWHTMLPMRIVAPGRVEIQGARGSVHLEFDPELAARIEDFENTQNRVMHRLTLHRRGQEGEIRVTAKLKPRD